METSHLGPGSVGNQILQGILIPARNLVLERLNFNKEGIICFECFLLAFSFFNSSEIHLSYDKI